MAVTATALLIATSFLFPAQVANATFDVASIRSHLPPLHNIMGLTLSGPRITMEAYTITQLIMEAYHLKGPWQISLPALRGRDDLLSVYYDVVGRAPGDTALSRNQFRTMIQTLLADRFKLTVHREMKDTPVYALVRGKNSPKLKNGTGESECSVNVSVASGGQSYSLSNCPIDRLVDVLGSGFVDRPIIDETKLTGKFTFRLVAMPMFMHRDQSDLADVNPFTAIEGLGLKLQAQTASMEIIVVDHVEKPTEN